jgi:hypothetical protein
MIPLSYHSWSLIAPSLPSNPTAIAATNSIALASPVAPFTQQDFLDLFDRLFPSHWLEPLKNPGPGYEILQMMAKIGERCSRSISVCIGDSYISSSVGGLKSTGTVEFYRSSPHPDGLDVIIRSGSTVTCSAGGQDFLTTADVMFLASDLGPLSVDIVAVANGYEWNVPGIMFAADGTPLPGEIDTIKNLIETPDFGDSTIKVRQLSATTGGQDASLDEHGSERGCIRYGDESDDSFRARIETLPDTISPSAVSRGCKRILDQYSASFEKIETWDVKFQTCYDAPNVSKTGNFDPMLLVLDDPRSRIPFRGRLLDEATLRGAFVVVVENIQPIRERRFILDDTVNSCLDLQSRKSGGERCLSAYDLSSVISDQYLQGCYDALDVPRDTVYKSLANTINAVKASGIEAFIAIDGE